MHLEKDVSRVETSEWAQVSTPSQPATTLYFHNLQFLYKLDTIAAEPLFKGRRRFLSRSTRHLFVPGLAPSSLPFPAFQPLIRYFLAATGLFCTIVLKSP